MKTLYLDCQMGAAGDMLTAALLELLPNPDAFVKRLNALAIPGMQTVCKKVMKCGISGSQISVTIHGMEENEETYAKTHSHHPHEHEHGHCHHSGMNNIKEIVAKLKLPQKVQEDVLSVYGLIAKAESHVHDMPVSQIHFHEVGAMDAVADITAVCLLMHELAPDEVIASPIHVGSGHVHCAHGILPVPAPATAYILKGIPIYGSEVQGELCTPTGAALLKHFVTRFGSMPVIRVQSIGYGMGKKDFPNVNCIRAMLGN